MAAYQYEKSQHSKVIPDVLHSWFSYIFFFLEIVDTNIFLIAFSFRMCKLLGQKFVDYLPVVMGPLMKAASIRPEVTMVDSLDVDILEEDAGWEFIKLGDQVRKLINICVLNV